MLPSLLGDFKEKYPDVNINLKVSNTEGIVSMVENNAIDLGIVEAPVGNKNLVVEVCRPDQLVAIVPPGHPEAGKESLTYADVAKYPFICREEGSGTREVIEEYLKGISDGSGDIQISMELGSPEAVKGAVEAGMGISIVSRATIQKEIKLGSLIAINLNPLLERPFSFVHQKQKFRVRVMEELLDFARGYIKEHEHDYQA
jgi:DNA-binding transcriptional LysR family regulator